jgi:hypothetical protein
MQGGHRILLIGRTGIASATIAAGDPKSLSTIELRGLLCGIDYRVHVVLFLRIVISSAPCFLLGRDDVVPLVGSRCKYGKTRSSGGGRANIDTMSEHFDGPAHDE